MTNRIHLGAIIEREGRILLIRQTPRSPWELPGGELQPRQTDADEAMAEALETFGILISEPEERFLETLYLPDGDGQIIYNLYGATDWSGEPEIPIGMGAGWYTFDELDAITMQDEVRTAILVAYGRKDAPNADAAILQAMSGAASDPGAIQPPLGAIPPLGALPADASLSMGPDEVAATSESLEPAAADLSPFARPASTEPAGAPGDENLEDDEPYAEDLLTVAEALDVPEAAAIRTQDESAEEDDGFKDDNGTISSLAQVADSISQELPMQTAMPEMGIGAPEPAAPAPAAPASRRERGLDVLGTLGATTDVAGRLAGLRKSYPELADDVVDFAMGDVWSGAALTRRERSLLVVAMLSAMGGRPGPLASHLNGAMNHGATPDELVETLRMVAVYAGFPAALEAWKLMETTFANRDEYPSGRAE